MPSWASAMIPNRPKIVPLTTRSTTGWGRPLARCAAWPTAVPASSPTIWPRMRNTAATIARGRYVMRLSGMSSTAPGLTNLTPASSPATAATQNTRREICPATWRT